MKARIVKSSGGEFWVGQIFANARWKTVTGNCWTIAGAKIALKQWKKKHCGIEFEL